MNDMLTTIPFSVHREPDGDIELEITAKWKPGFWTGSGNQRRWEGPEFDGIEAIRVPDGTTFELTDEEEEQAQQAIEANQQS